MKDQLESLVGMMVDRGILLEEAVTEFEKKFIKRVLERLNGNQSRAAKILGIDTAGARALPGVVDDYTTETALARELQAQHGQLPWLDFACYTSWPPERDALP